MTDTLKPISELRCGDLVDLQGDKYADQASDKPALEFEYATVCYIERETPDCIAIGFDGFDLIGFPPGHAVPVAPCQTIKTAVPQTPCDVRKDLAASLACYTSADDWGVERRAFLQDVRDRIDMDLATGEY